MNDPVHLGVEDRIYRDLAQRGAEASSYWVHEAACRGLPEEYAEIFFDPGEGKQNSIQAIERRKQAKEICHQCPVMMKCRELYLGEEHGVFGGLDRDERREIRGALFTQRDLAKQGRDLGREAYEQQRRGVALATIARNFGVRTTRLKTFLEYYLASAEGQQERVRSQVKELHDKGLSALDIAHELGESVPKVLHIQRQLGLTERRMSQVPEKLPSGFHDSRVLALGASLRATYLGESADTPPWFFMQIQYPQGTTRKWLPECQVTLGEQVRRHVIQAEGVVPSGKKRDGRRRSSESAGASAA